MGSKTVVMNAKTTEVAGDDLTLVKPTAPLGIQSDTAFSEASKRLNGRDLCSIADLTVQEMAAIMELAHAVKNHPEDFRHALDAKQMVMFFEKASLRTRLTFEAAINTLGGNAIFVDQTQSPLGERESLADMARNLERWMNIIVLRTYAHETITEMAASSKVPSSTPSPISNTPARPSPTSSPWKNASAQRKAFTSPTSVTATTSATRSC